VAPSLSLIVPLPGQCLKENFLNFFLNVHLFFSVTYSLISVAGNMDE
jgi:hypothetical protein